MIPITNSEMEYLTKVAKVPFGEGGISRSYAHNHSYYLCESPKNKKILADYYQSIGREAKVICKNH